MKTCSTPAKRILCAALIAGVVVLSVYWVRPAADNPDPAAELDEILEPTIEPRLISQRREAPGDQDLGEGTKELFRIEGRVVDESNQPVAAGFVRLAQGSDTDTDQQQWSVQQDGTFVIEGLVPKRTDGQVYFESKDLTSLRQSVQLEPGTKPPPMVLYAYRRAVVRVSVVDIANRPVAGAHVATLPVSLAPRAPIRSDDNGIAVLRIFPESVSAITAKFGNFVGKTKALWLAPGKVTTVRVQLTDRVEQTSLVIVDVTDSQDLREKRGRFRFAQSVTDWVPFVVGTPVHLPLTTGRLPPMTIDLGSLGDTRIGTRVLMKVRDGSTLRVPIGGSPSVQLALKGERGEPHAGLSAVLVRGARRLHAVSDESGMVEFSSTPAGTYELACGGTVVGSMEVPEGISYRHDVVISDVSTVSGTYVGPRLVQGRRVGIRLGSHGPRVGVAEDGSWVVSTCLPHGAEVRVRADIGTGERDVLDSAEVRLGDEKVDLSGLGSSTSLHLREGNRIRLIGWARLSADGKPRTSWVAIDRRTGRATFRSLPVGVYDLQLCRDAWGSVGLRSVFRAVDVQEGVSEYSVQIR